MHVFGLLTSAATLLEMEDILISMAVVFSSPQSGDNVEKHFRNLQSKMLNIDISGDMTDITDEDVEEGFFYSVSIIMIFLLKLNFFYFCGTISTNGDNSNY